MTTQPLPQTLDYFVEEKVERELLGEIAQEFAEEVEEELSGPDYELSYKELVAVTYPAEISLILEENYVEHFQMGYAPLPLSPFWLAVLQVPFIWRRYASAFRKGYREEQRKVGYR